MPRRRSGCRRHLLTSEIWEHDGRGGSLELTIAKARLSRQRAGADVPHEKARRHAVGYCAQHDSTDREGNLARHESGRSPRARETSSRTPSRRCRHPPTTPTPRDPTRTGTAGPAPCACPAPFRAPAPHASQTPGPCRHHHASPANGANQHGTFMWRPRGAARRFGMGHTDLNASGCPDISKRRLGPLPAGLLRFSQRC